MSRAVFVFSNVHSAFRMTPIISNLPEEPLPTKSWNVPPGIGIQLDRYFRGDSVKTSAASNLFSQLYAERMLDDIWTNFINITMILH
ncbi:hypothetical protein I7I50_06939 [Histoplasma capsulatum G186AR]|uniref:Uncharacterized protein n=1 Tax=Ajellomyces capsulatus TaxID=5037 RepID=A0A8H8D3F1_AJECA|nr:hypothetical protein I7I52_09987 [Histoplasma capsulatum]QSS67760.1 hypothetical protein I7I50_06939 [Histoplasma capsulatum G186AR]